MAVYYTQEDLRTQAGPSMASAQESLRRQSKAAIGPFDVFLSHSVRDARVVLGLRSLLQARGLTVYVDWIDDPELDRTHVSAATAARLRQRMDQCRTLVYAVSRAAQTSRWMPWELGYFDGGRGQDRISLFPIEDHSGRQFEGQEYLELYKVVEKVGTGDGRFAPFAVRPSSMEGEPIESFGKSQNRFQTLVRS